MKRLVYEFLRVVFHFALHLFYRRIQIVGAERIPRDKPVVLVANHVNGIIDPILLAMTTGRPLRFLAKAPLFKTLLFGPLLRITNGVPVYRRDPRDWPDGKIPEHLAHDDMFQAAYNTLQQGESICLFPEGISHSLPQLQELKTGAARILLGAEAQAGYQLGVHLVPVGLTFENAGLFRSRVLVRVGEAFTGAAHFEIHRQDAVEAARRLTEDLANALRKVTLNFESDEEKQFFLTAAEVLHGHRRLDETLFEVVREWTPIYRHYRTHASEALQGFRERLLDYVQYREALALDERVVTLRTHWFAPLLFLMRGIPGALLTLAVAIPALVLNMVPFLLCRWVGRGRKYLDERATAQVAAGFVFYPPTWVLWALIVGSEAGWRWGLSVALAGPLLGWLTLPLVAQGANDMDLAKAWLFFRTYPRLQTFLQAKRDELMKQLESARVSYEGDGREHG